MKRRTFLAQLASAPVIVPAMWADRQKFQQDPTNMKTSNSASMWTYPWDLADEGYDKPVRMMKDHGLTSVSLATAYHAGKFLAPHNPKHKVIFLEDGSVYFEPNERKYGRIHPIVNSLVGEGHGLRRVKIACDAAGLETRAWVVCCHNTPLGMQYPDIVSRTVFGDPLYHNLCPGNPDVRSYLRALVSDIALTGVTVIELEAMQFQGYAHGFHHEREGFPLGTTPRFLLGLCFCSHCEKNAFAYGVPWEEIKHYVASTLQTYFDDPDTKEIDLPGLDGLPRGLFGPLEQWRRSVVSSLAEELMEAVEGTGVRLRPLVSFDATARRFVGMDPRGVAGVCGGILVPGYVRTGEELKNVLLPVQEEIGDADLTVGFQVGFPGSGGREDLIGRVAAAREIGIHQFNFYNYGLIPLPRFAWIRDALGASE